MTNKRIYIKLAKKKSKKEETGFVPLIIPCSYYSFLHLHTIPYTYPMYVNERGTDIKTFFIYLPRFILLLSVVKLRNWKSSGIFLRTCTNDWKQLNSHLYNRARHNRLHTSQSVLSISIPNCRKKMHEQ